LEYSPVQSLLLGHSPRRIARWQENGECRSLRKVIVKTLKPEWRRTRIVAAAGIVFRKATRKGSRGSRAEATLRDYGITIEPSPEATVTAGGVRSAIYEFRWLLDLLIDGNPFEYTSTSLPLPRLIADRLDNIRKNGFVLQIDGVSDRHGQPLTMGVSK
jgi:hypothetical protein